MCSTGQMEARLRSGHALKQLLLRSTFTIMTNTCSLSRVALYPHHSRREDSDEGRAGVSDSAWGGTQRRSSRRNQNNPRVRRAPSRPRATLLSSLHQSTRNPFARHSSFLRFAPVSHTLRAFQFRQLRSSTSLHFIQTSTKGLCTRG